jgi:site-specific DNA-methyltransferase (adenine-specific)
MNIIYETNYGKIVNGDNVDVLKELEDSSVDSCISDFPYAIEFMGKNWDSAKHWNTGEGIHGRFEGTGYSGKRRPAFYLNTNEDGLKFYDWCYERAVELMRVMKPGGYVAIFGHPKMNHRMKCAFDDAGFQIVEEIDWIYMSGMPKCQDIGKLYDKKVGAEREDDCVLTGEYDITKPATEFSEKWDGWKTDGLKPAHEPITIFKKPMIGTYIENIEQFGCGAMNVGACRVPLSEDELNAPEKLTLRKPKNGDVFNTDSCGFDNTKCYTASASKDGRFPPNVVFDDGSAEILDEQTGTTKPTGGSGDASTVNRSRSIYGVYNNEINENYQNNSLGGYGDSGGGSRIFPVFKYSAKVSPQERTLPNGQRNPHVTVKPVELIAWLIKLLTPNDGLTIDITAGSCTHAVACEQLNYKSGYSLKYVDIELCNDEENPYCEVGRQRVEGYRDTQKRKLF